MAGAEIDVRSLFALDGRVAVVTGASSGLGERFARVLASAGATVVAVARRGDRLDALAASVAGIEAHVADLSDDEQRAGVIAAVLERHGRVDVLVNNAGYGGTKAAAEQGMGGLRRMFELNVFAMFDLSKHAGRAMIGAGRGSIVNIASMYGLVASAPIASSAYVASKGAVVQLTRQLGCEWAPHGVRVNAIAPGFFPAESTEAMMQDEASNAYVARNTPMGRYGRDGELDGAVLYLAGDASTYCTGTVLSVDGGWTAR